jgi:hypothetical protein
MIALIVEPKSQTHSSKKQNGGCCQGVREGGNLSGVAQKLLFVQDDSV